MLHIYRNAFSAEVRLGGSWFVLSRRNGVSLIDPPTSLAILPNAPSCAEMVVRLRCGWRNVKSTNATASKTIEVPYLQTVSSPLFESVFAADLWAKTGSAFRRQSSKGNDRGLEGGCAISWQTDGNEKSDADPRGSFDGKESYSPKRIISGVRPTYTSSPSNPDDVVVKVQGSAVSLTLGPVEDGQYTFIGPVFLTYGSIYLPPDFPDTPYVQFTCSTRSPGREN